MQKIKQVVTYSNLVASLAIFLALGGAAVAATKAPKNSVVSSSIKNSAVKGKDVKDESLTGADIDEQSLSLTLPQAAAELGPNTVGSEEVVDGSLTGTDFKDDSISGDDVDENALDAVPVAKQGGTGRYGFNGSCNPTSLVYELCSNTSVDLAKPGRVLMIATVEGQTEAGKDSGGGLCFLADSGNGKIQASEILVYTSNDTLAQRTLTAVSNVLPAGTHQVTVQCNEASTGATSAITFPQVRTSVVALSAE